MQFTADVISGSGRGKEIGVPTINVRAEQVSTDLEDGVYACFVRLGTTGPRFAGAMHLGSRPTFNAERSCEVHVIDQLVGIPPLQLTIDPVEKIREVQKFASVDALKAQLQADIETARGKLASCSIT